MKILKIDEYLVINSYTGSRKWLQKKPLRPKTTEIIVHIKGTVKYPEPIFTADFGELTMEFSYLDSEDFEDSATGEKIEYMIKEEKTFELCANFRASNKEEFDIYNDIYGKEWRHNAGQQCFERKIREADIIGEPRPL